MQETCFFPWPNTGGIKLKTYRKILDGIIRAIVHFLAFLLTSVVVIIALQVISRYLIGSPLMWTEQLCRFIFIWMMMLGIPCLFHNKNFMAFDLILEGIKGIPHNILRMVIDLVIIAFAVFWLQGDTLLIAGTYKKWTTGVRIPYYMLYCVQGISAFLLFNVMLLQLLEEIRTLADRLKKKNREVET